LVIFIITAPLFASSIKLQLPNAKGTATESRSESITLSIQADGALFWNDTALALPALQARLTALAAQAPDTQIRLRVDKAAQFDVVAKVLSMAQGSGLTRVGFVTEPVGGG
jgi:biopolymer transport protein ExbD